MDLTDAGLNTKISRERKVSIHRRESPANAWKVLATNRNEGRLVGAKCLNLHAIPTFSWTSLLGQPKSSFMVQEYFGLFVLVGLSYKYVCNLQIYP